MDRGAGNGIQLFSGNAYYVAPLIHVELSLGIILSCNSIGNICERTITFADKLAEQGYKVIVPILRNDNETKSSSNIGINSEKELSRNDIFCPIMNECIEYLQRDQLVQKISCIGIGDGSLHLAKYCETKLSFSCMIFCYPTNNLNEFQQINCPTFFVFGDKDNRIPLLKIQEFLNSNQDNPLVKIKIYEDQPHGFLDSCIENEDVTVLALADVLDFLAAYLRPKTDSTKGKIQSLIYYLLTVCLNKKTIGSDPWWPNGPDGEFHNFGLSKWEDIRKKWKIQVGERPNRPASHPIASIAECLTSNKSTFDFPTPIALGDIVEVFIDMWELNKDQ